MLVKSLGDLTNSMDGVIQRMRADVLALDERWHDVGRLDRLQWRVAPGQPDAVAIEWSYVYGEVTVRVLVSLAGYGTPHVEWSRFHTYKITPRHADHNYSVLFRDIESLTASVADGFANHG